MYTRNLRRNTKRASESAESASIDSSHIEKKPAERKTTAKRSNQKAGSKLKVIPLGGLHEIGKNITAFEYEDEILIVDCGVAFPEDDMLGIDLVIPDFSYLVKNREKVLGVVLTHGHEDHIGSLPYFLKELNVPIYGTKLTIGLVETKLKEHNILNSVQS